MASQCIGNRLILWFNKEQNFCLCITTKAKYIATDSCRAQILIFSNMLSNYIFNFKTMPLLCNNTILLFNTPELSILILGITLFVICKMDVVVHLPFTNF